MSLERTGLVEHLQLQGAKYAKFFRRPPEERTAADVSAAELLKLETENAELKGKVKDLEVIVDRLRASARIPIIEPSVAKPEEVAAIFCREMKTAGYEIEGIPYMIEHLTTPRRGQLFARPRHVFMWSARRACSGYSLPKIGKYLGGRDHTTVMHGCHNATKVMREDPTLRAVAQVTLAHFGIELSQ
jgi:chromosomal replication initiation ATPase DnaA